MFLSILNRLRRWAKDRLEVLLMFLSVLDRLWSWSRNRLKMLFVFLSVFDSLRRRARDGLEVLFMFMSVLDRLRGWTRDRLEVLFVLMVLQRSSLWDRLGTLLVDGSKIGWWRRSWNRNRGRGSRGSTRLIPTGWWWRRSVIV